MLSEHPEEEVNCVVMKILRPVFDFHLIGAASIHEPNPLSLGAVFSVNAQTDSGIGSREKKCIW